MSNCVEQAAGLLAGVGLPGGDSVLVLNIRVRHMTVDCGVVVCAGG